MSATRPTQGTRLPAEGTSQGDFGGGMTSHGTHAFTGLRGVLERNVSLARCTSWRAGGPAEILFRPADRDDLAAFVRQLPAGVPLHVMGLGSNTLVRDGGVRGAVVVMHDPGAVLAVADGLVYAEAGVASPKVARLAARLGCEGAEFLAVVVLRHHLERCTHLLSRVAEELDLVHFTRQLPQRAVVSRHPSAGPQGRMVRA